MEPSRHPWIDPVLAAVSLTRKGVFWFRERIPGTSQWSGDNRESRDTALQALAECLYERFYTRGSPSPFLQRAPIAAADKDFVRNVASAGEQAGGRELIIRPAYSPGFMMVQSRRLPPKGSPQVRLYYNVAPLSVDRFVSSLVQLLHNARLTFSLKVLNNPDLYDRCDCYVLYLQDSDVSKFVEQLESAVPSIDPFLRSGVPALVRRIGHGIGIAESPDNRGTSFGQHRSSILAEGLLT